MAKIVGYQESIFQKGRIYQMKSLLCLLLSLFVVHGFLVGTSLRSKGGKVHESSSLWMNDVGPRSEHARALGTAKQVFSAASSVAVACTTVTKLPVRVWADEKTKKKKKLKVKETDSGVKYVELKQGNGPFPNDGDYVSIVYTAYLVSFPLPVAAAPWLLHLTLPLPP